jgi:hypothetical protein
VVASEVHHRVHDGRLFSGLSLGMKAWGDWLHEDGQDLGSRGCVDDQIVSMVLEAPRINTVDGRRDSETIHIEYQHLSRS